MKVSIITPCLNSEKTIKQTIESVLHQTYSDIEYIIVDGGSTDHTLSIIREFIPLFNGRLQYISEEDKGIYDAMNKGIRLSSGQLIGIINSDDYYEFHTVESVVANYKPRGEQVIYGYMNMIKGKRKDKVFFRHHQNLDEGMIAHSTCFVSRAVYRKYGLFDRKYKIAADYELMLRLYKKTNVEFVPIFQILSNFRSGGTSSTKRTQLEKKMIQLKYGCISLKEFTVFLIHYFIGCIT